MSIRITARKHICALEPTYHVKVQMSISMAEVHGWTGGGPLGSTSY